MGGKKDQQRTQIVTDYYLSIHYGVCSGPVDSVLEIKVGDKIASAPNVNSGTIGISNPGLFGGPLQEGGVSGSVDIMGGQPTQTMSAALAARLGVDAATAPAFRGILSLFFYGGGGFLWGTNTPYLKPVSIRCAKYHEELDPSTARIPRCCIIVGEGGGVQYYDHNPAHIIYTAMTNQEWGMAVPTFSLDTTSFLNAALVLYEECFGLSLLWSKQSTIEDFVQEILNHIQGVIFVNPRTGLITLKLIRDDYDIDALPILTDEQITIISLNKRLWSDTINEVVVSWTNPDSEETETIGWQNPANIAIQGGVVSDSRNYYGVRCATLAQTLAIRDLRAASAPLAVLELEADRTAWDYVVGDVFKITYPEYDIVELVVRINNIDYGRPGDPKIKINCTEDVFGLAKASFVSLPPGTASEPTESEPFNMQFVTINSLPYAIASALFSAAGIEDPDEAVGVLAAQPNDFGGRDTSEYDLWGPRTNAAGVESEQLLAAGRSTLRRAILGSPLESEGESTVDTSIFTNQTNGVVGPVSGGVMIVGGASRFAPDGIGDLEWMLITDVTGTTVTINRGVLDTVPRVWSAGAPVWFLSEQASRIHDPNLRADGDTITYHILTHTSLGTLALADANDHDYTIEERYRNPTRPADIRINDSAGPYFDAR